MDGLECVELKYSEISDIDNNKTLRFDSEFFSKETITALEKLSASNHFYLDKKSIVSGPFGSTLKSSSYLSKGDIPFVRIEDIKGGFYVKRDNLIYISHSDNNRIKNSQLIVDDLILSKVGNSIGFFARVDDELKTCNISENNIGIKLSTYDKEKKHIILAYLNSYYGQAVLLSKKSGNAQPKLNVEDICHIPIPDFSIEFSRLVSQCIIASEKSYKSSNIKYSEAESILNSFLGIGFDKLSNSGLSIKKLSDSYNKTGRLDSEYYQLKYDELIAKLKSLNSYKLGTDEGICTFKKSIEPGSGYYQDEGIPFIRVSDISKFGIQESEIKLPYDVDDNIERLYPKKDTILFSKDGSIGIAYKVDKDLKVITSGALLHLNIKDINKVLPEYLTLVLNSRLVQMQAERDSNGAVIQHWRIDEISNVLIPVAPMEIQIDIENKINESFRLRKESEELIKKGIRAVEIAIEKSEDEAIKYLESGS